MLPAFIDEATLAALQARGEDLALCDVRWYLDGRSGLSAYNDAHLPGAVFVDLDHALAGQPEAAVGRHPLPDPGEFAAELGGFGIGEDTTVVAYDDDGGVVAARLVFMLRILGTNAAVLDGGLTAWSGPLEADAHTRAPVARAPRPFPSERLATIEEASDLERVVIDARPAERYRGDATGPDPRSGHIPGARSFPCRENLDAEKRLLPEPELRARLAAAGVTEGAEVVSYCGSGVTACHNLLVLEQLGFPPGRLFPGSWSQYAADETRPIATGSAP